nr:serine/threonine protein kinase [Deltaproteobacteria bacterium]
FAKVARSMLGMPTALPTIGRFEVRERIGSGGMGDVYGAHDPQTGRDVAIKLIRADRDADTAAVRRIKREARALTRLAHPHVVKIHEVGTAEGRVFITMELLRGHTLAETLDSEAQLRPHRVFEILAAVCDALAQAHALGIIHRDLKPANIFLADDPPCVKILDFGLAKIASAGTLDLSTASGTVMGTLHYMSPEQARDSTKIDHRCDLWAVAIIAYECVVGARVFSADNLPEHAVQLLGGHTPTPSEHADVPPGFDAWFQRATASDVDQRYGSAAELVDSLADALGQPHRARASVPARRRWAAPAAATAAVAGLLAGGWWSTRDGPQPSEPSSVPPPRSSAAMIDPAVEAAPDVPPPAAPSSIELHIAGAPVGATVWNDEVQLGDTSDAIVLPRDDEPLHLRLEAEGFVPLAIDFVPIEDHRRIVQMVPTAPDRPRPKSTRRPAPETVDDLEF